jgi:replicative DNA helicase
MPLSFSVPVLKRRARLLSRQLTIPLSAALDRVAREQGFRTWSHLASTAPAQHLATTLFAQLEPEDFVLLGSRPRQGKTRLGLDLVAEAVLRGGSAAFFTLEFTEAQVRAGLGPTLGETRVTQAVAAKRLRIDVSEGICADHIIRELGEPARGTLVIVDYLQLLDQRRQAPALVDQVGDLRALSRDRGVIIVCLSQVSRSFEHSARDLPTLADVRLPNPLNLDLFTKACFLHEGRMSFTRQRRLHAD